MKFRTLAVSAALAALAACGSNNHANNAVGVNAANDMGVSDLNATQMNATELNAAAGAGETNASGNATANAGSNY
jgi:hypothetical protein